MVVLLLYKCIVDYLNVLVEGGVNFWDVFYLIVVGEVFWYEGVCLEVFLVCYYWLEMVYGLCLQGVLIWSGDIWLILEMLVCYVNDNELIVYDCGLYGNLLYMGVDDLECEYSIELQVWMMFYYYVSVVDGQVLVVCGYCVVQLGQCVLLVDLIVLYVLVQDLL